jgi:hypothetical protein
VRPLIRAAALLLLTAHLAASLAASLGPWAAAAPAPKPKAPAPRPPLAGEWQVAWGDWPGKATLHPSGLWECDWGRGWGRSVGEWRLAGGRLEVRERRASEPLAEWAPWAAELEPEKTSGRLENGAPFSLGKPKGGK